MKATDTILWRKNPAAAAQVDKDTATAALTSPAIDVAKRQATFILSTPAVDRYGDTIDQTGWKLDNYNKNSVVLINHNSWALGVGPGKAWVEDGLLKGRVTFATTADAEDAWTLVQCGGLRATSVGFKPLTYVENAERKGPWGYPGIDFKSQELLEWSLVSIPANPECVLDDQAKACLERVVRRSLEAGGGVPLPAEYREDFLAWMKSGKAQPPVARSAPKGAAPVRKGNSHGMSKEFEAHFSQAEKSLAACRALHDGDEADAPEPDEPPPPEPETDKDDEQEDPPADKAFDDMSDAELVETLKGPRGPELQRVMVERAATLKRKQAGKLD